MKSLTLITILLLFWSSSFAQWTNIKAIPSQSISAIASMRDTLYVASGTNLLFKSTDGGTSWSTITVSTLSINIYTLKIIENIIYIGTTKHGIFTSGNYGATWTNSNSTIQWVSGFGKFNGNVYASIGGSGVYKYDSTNNSWFPFNNQLPSKWAYNVETIVTTSSKLLIGAGGNGMFFHYDFNTDQWVQEYYYGQNRPGLLIQKIINQSDTLFAVDGRRILRSNNGGLNWEEDNIGSHNGLARVIFSGSTHLYTITNLLGGNAWIQKRQKHSEIGISWTTDEEFFETLYAYDIFEFKNKLYLATNDGLYVKDMFLGITKPRNISSQVKVFPNPSKDGRINITSTFKMNNISISDIMGQSIYSTTISGHSFEIDHHFKKGLYLITIRLDNNQTLTQKIVIE